MVVIEVLEAVEDGIDFVDAAGELWAASLLRISHFGAGRSPHISVASPPMTR
jgi:hypothetical protein